MDDNSQGEEMCSQAKSQNQIIELLQSISKLDNQLTAVNLSHSHVRAIIGHMSRPHIPRSIKRTPSISVEHHQSAILNYISATRRVQIICPRLQ